MHIKALFAYLTENYGFFYTGEYSPLLESSWYSTFAFESAKTVDEQTFAISTLVVLPGIIAQCQFVKTARLQMKFDALKQLIPDIKRQIKNGNSSWCVVGTFKDGQRLYIVGLPKSVLLTYREQNQGLC